MYRLTKLSSLKTVEQFRHHTQVLGIELPLDDALQPEHSSPLMQPIHWDGRTVGNRIAVQPMEGWDGTLQGGVTEPMRRRWRRFGESGAKLIWGGEAMAVCPSGRANPNQLILIERNRDDLGMLLRELREEHRMRFGDDEDLVVGFQLTHSGRFCRPNTHQRWEPRIAHRHPLLDTKLGVTDDRCIMTSAEIRELIRDYVRAAVLARDVGADFVDIKCCHGYLLHEFLGAHTRDDEYGGSLENRIRIVLEIISAIRSECPDLGIGVRLSIFDAVPFEPDPTTAVDGRLGQGRPMAFQPFLPYRWGFGVSQDNPCEIDLTEPLRCIHLLISAGVSMLNATAGSPYYTPHLLRPAAFPPSDGYQPHEDPLISVAKQVAATRAVKFAFPSLVVVGSGYSYLQEFLPAVAQHNVRQGWTDFVGIGRSVLSYPEVLMDAVVRGLSQRKRVCRTFSDCTTAPRNGLPSGCYPLDEYYKDSTDAETVKKIKSKL